jgi:hypothetical protein
LRTVRCDQTDDQMNRFASRQSDDEVIDFLRSLRVKLPSYEPLYLAEFHVGNDASTQARTVARMMTKAPPPRSMSIGSDTSSITAPSSMGDDSYVDSPPLSPAKSDVKPISSRSESILLSNKSNAQATRRPSMIKSTQILEA